LEEKTWAVKMPLLLPNRAAYFGVLIGLNLIELRPLTLYEWFSLLVSIAGFAGIIVTLYLLRAENRLADRALKESALSPLKVQQLEIDKIFIEHPHLRKYFYDNAAIRDEASLEAAPAFALAEYILDHFAAILPHTTISGEPLTSTIWRNYISGTVLHRVVFFQILCKNA
jgi:hypothetical protein